MSNGFELFTLINKEEKSTEVKQDNTLCSHENLICEKGTTLCCDCGMEVNNKVMIDKDWKYYGITDTKHSLDPNRCYIRKTNDKSIYNDLKNMEISNHIKDIANKIYLEVCNGKVHRGVRRKSIVFASIFHAYKIDNSPQSCESLLKIFKIKRKDALKGLKFINDNISKNSPIRTLYITPEHIISEFLYKFKVSDKKKKEIINLYTSIKNRSTILNRSRPQSVASGVIWYWIRLNNKKITIKEFIKKVQLSELTVSKMSKEVERLLTQ
jgi:hypothetical protein